MSNFLVERLNPPKGILLFDCPQCKGTGILAGSEVWHPIFDRNVGRVLERAKACPLCIGFLKVTEAEMADYMRECLSK